jgi:hypothetical protein
MAIVYIIVIILKAPFLVVKWLLTHRMALILAGAVVAAVVLFNIGTGGSSRKNEPVYQKIEPDTKWVTPTASRLYYTDAYYQDANYFYLTDWYEYTNDEWQHRTVTLPVLKNRAVMKPRSEGVDSDG